MSGTALKTLQSLRIYRRRYLAWTRHLREQWLWWLKTHNLPENYTGIEGINAGFTIREDDQQQKLILERKPGPDVTYDRFWWRQHA